MKGSTRETILYMVIGVALAWGINQGLAAALTTDMPVVAVESNSMVPVFFKGDILVLNGIKAADYNIGDIIVYSVAGRPVPIVHRVIKINPDGSFQTKGDANSGQLDFEQYVDPKNVHGRIVAIVPYLGWVKIGIMQYLLPNVILLVIAILAVVFIYYGRRLV